MVKLSGEELDMKIQSTVKSGNMSEVRELLETYVDVTTRKINGFGATALHFAAQYGHVDVAKLLIQNGADVNTECDYKITCLHYAAMSTKRADVAKLLVQNGADVNAVDELGNETSLHIAAKWGNVDMTTFLIQNGADVNIKNKKNKTCLHFAGKYGEIEVMKVLIQNGADVNAVDIDNSTSLHNVASERYVDVAKLLIQNGADVNAVNKRKQSVLCHASYLSRSVPITLELLCLGAKIDKNALKNDKTGLLCKIEERMDKLRNGNRATYLYSKKEVQFMWNIKFCLSWKYKEASFKAYNIIRSFVTFNGIFMAPGFDLGPESIWKMQIEESSDDGRW